MPATIGDPAFGVDQSNPEVQKKGLELATTYADQGYGSAIMHLHDAYLHGSFGLAKNTIQAIKILQTYADQGSEDAINRLIETYIYGCFEIQSDFKKAIELAKKYADQGFESAIHYLLHLYQSTKQDQKKGLELLKTYADQGSKEANQFLVKAYKEGHFGLDDNSENYKKGEEIEQAWKDRNPGQDLFY